MFNFMKKFKKDDNKEVEFLAPLDGKVINLSEVKDEVFSSKMVGDGVAIDSTGSVVKSPVDGTIQMIFDTNHAFAVQLENGAETLVHIGLDTVNLKGEGFKRLVEVGAKVKCGQPVIEIDRKVIEDNGYSLVTPVLVTNMEVVDNMEYMNIGEKIAAGEGKILKISTK